MIRAIGRAGVVAALWLTFAAGAADVPPPPAPDYDNAAAWAAGPAGPGAAAALPRGATPAAHKPKVDVFYVHPTTSRADGFNQDPRDAAENRWVDDSAVARQASAFSACCRVFAPRYRAATYRALTDPAARDAAFELAYSDVERAFDRHLAHHNGGRPFILAGHSQGAAHIATLIERRIDGTPLQRRLVAAYIIGINLAEGDFGRRFRSIDTCAMPDSTGCIVQWNAVRAGADLAAIRERMEQPFVAKFGDSVTKTLLCINPLTFDRRRPAASRAASRGAVPGDPGAGLPRPLVARAVSAECRQGLLSVEDESSLGLKALPTGSLHYHDVGLFYADIRANAVHRVRSFVRRRSAHWPDDTMGRW